MTRLSTRVMAQRLRADITILEVLTRARRDLTLADISHRAHLPIMACAYSLRRLHGKGLIWQASDIIDQPSRYRETILRFRLAHRIFERPPLLPDWLCPRATTAPTTHSTRRVCYAEED